MTVLVTGANGLIGRALIGRLTERGDRAIALGRSEYPGRFWNNLPDFHFDAVVHLAGEPIAAKRWSAEQKQRIRDSRIIGTQQLCEELSILRDKPRVVVAASAVGYYGDRGDEILNEESEPGEGFLADLCREWEDACEPAREAGIRTVNLRIGMVLSPHGGALDKLRPLFKAGLGGKLGSGRQYMSWIIIDDLVEAILFSIENEHIAGPVNGVSPNPATNYEFTKTLGKALGRPTLLPVPSFALRISVGEMADEMLLSSQRVIPNKLLDAGFGFGEPELVDALVGVR